MLTTYKTAEQKYLFETYANEEGFVNQETIDRLSNLLSNDVYVRPEGESDYKTKATNAEKKFLAQLIGAGLWQSETEKISIQFQVLLNICSCVGTPTTMEDI